MVEYERPAAPDPEVEQSDAIASRAGTTPGGTWAALMHRVFALDVLACPRCGGHLRVIATVQDPAVVRTILARLARTNAPDPPGPAPPAPAALT